MVNAPLSVRVPNPTPGAITPPAATFTEFVPPSAIYPPPPRMPPLCTSTSPVPRPDVSGPVLVTKSVPASTPVSIAISKDLSSRGFKFVGPTIVYAFMQATGMVNDHLVTCHCYGTSSKLKRKPRKT